MSRTMRLILLPAAALALILAAATARGQQDNAPPELEANRRPVRGDRADRRRPAQPGDRNPGPNADPAWRNRMRLFYEERQMDRLMENLRQGNPLDPQMEQMLERAIGSRLLRSPGLSPIDLAHYSVAEIHLQQKDIDLCLKRLQTVLDSHPDQANEAVWVTHLNLALLNRAQRGDVQSALKHFKQVQGLWAGFARQQLLKTYEEAGQIEEAAALLKSDTGNADEKGARLAMLRAIAELYQRNQQHDKAIEYYDKITKEFTAEDIAAIIKAVQDQVKQSADKVIALRNEGRHEEARQLIQQAEARLRTLRGQDRHEEADAYQQAMDQARRSMEPQEEKHGQPRPEP